MVPVCSECDTPPLERFGPELAYEPVGFVSAAEAEAGVTRVLGEERLARDRAIERKLSVTPAPSVPHDEREWIDHVAETKRRASTKAHRIDHRQRRSGRERKVY